MLSVTSVEHHIERGGEAGEAYWAVQFWPFRNVTAHLGASVPVQRQQHQRLKSRFHESFPGAASSWIQSSLA